MKKRIRIKDLLETLLVCYLGLHFPSNTIISRSGSTFCTPLFMDERTMKRGRLEFARVCLEVKAYETLFDVIWAKLRNDYLDYVMVVFDWKSECVACKAFGHLSNRCPTAKVWVEKTRWIC